jgi:hypothetical protein
MNSPECEVGARKLRLRHGLSILQGLPSESSERNQEVERCKATLLARQTGTAASPSRPFLESRLVRLGKGALRGGKLEDLRLPGLCSKLTDFNFLAHVF